MKHCCKNMTRNIKDGEIHLNYFPDDREYSIEYRKEFGASEHLIYFCPWCGVKLPESLAEKRETLLDEMFEDYDGDDDPRIPEEFKTDEWWKKRGL
ncbi:MAG: hypothetical protein GY804_02610 [Alphaproteobacteria bacterium]|nr:hypothetical protein [Alphaproteobacteria bacterium]